MQDSLEGREDKWAVVAQWVQEVVWDLEAQDNQDKILESEWPLEQDNNITNSINNEVNEQKIWIEFNKKKQ